LILLLAGLCAMYAPVFYDVAITLWTTDDEAHGPLIALVALYFAWKKRGPFGTVRQHPDWRLGLPLFIAGWLIYVFGVSQDIVNLQLLSLLLVIAGLILVHRGGAALRVMAFPILFLVFMFPVPAFLFDALTQPLKSWVSYATDQILYTAGYPIAREGVILSIGQYQLLVADACSGLRSLVSLSALGVLFIYITGRASRLHNALMLAGIIPLAMLANLIRVIALVLITYHLGDEAGQGYLHGTAGMVLFMAAMGGLIGLDVLLNRLLGKPTRAKPGNLA
jgi:exosortase B